MTNIKNRFLEGWGKYFPGAEFPIIFYYTDEETDIPRAAKPAAWRCLICDLMRVREGQSLAFGAEAIACAGGRRYLGLAHELRPDFEHFLSCGIPGKMEGERYKKTPQLVRAMMDQQPPFTAPGRFIVFKRWDALRDQDRPLGVIFFAEPDVLSGLFTLANFDRPSPFSVIAPSCSGCSSIVYYPYMESLSDSPRAILGMFDTSARPYVPSSVLTFSIPYTRFVGMVDNMDESHLTTATWEKLRDRISRGR